MCNALKQGSNMITIMLWACLASKDLKNSKRVKAHYGGTFWARKCTHFKYTLYYFRGRFFFISSSILKNIEIGFLTQILLHNSCYLSNDNVFPKNIYVFTHLCLFEWKTSSKCFLWNHMNETFHIELKWDNELICKYDWIFHQIW
jgi:hypothetical protein